MWSGRVLIHIGWRRFPVARTKIHCLFDLGNAFNYTTRQVFDKYTLTWVFFQIELDLLLFSFNQKIVNLFVIDFQITTSYQELHVLILLINKTKNVGETVWNNAPKFRITWYTKHCVSLSTPCLTICENGSIVTFDYRFYERKSTLIIDLLLLRIDIINRIICEILIWSFTIRSDELDLVLGLVNLYTWFAAKVFLFLVHWSHTDHNLNSFCVTWFWHYCLAAIFKLINK